MSLTCGFCTNETDGYCGCMLPMCKDCYELWVALWSRDWVTGKEGMIAEHKKCLLRRGLPSWEKEALDADGC